jgi:3-oxoacyl-[acyl-carrier protein] reductase
VTGASKGIGAGIATALGAAGANVAVGYVRDQEGAEHVAAEIRAAGGQAITVQSDLARTADIEAIARAVATCGPIDILVNNAAVFDFKALPDIDEVHFHHIFKTNVLGLLATTGPPSRISIPPAEASSTSAPCLLWGMHRPAQSTPHPRPQ